MNHFLTLVFVVFQFCSHCSFAGDWPQVLGPDRNGIAMDETIAQTLDSKIHKTVWTAPLGQGFAGPVVVGDRVIVFHRLGENERVEAIDRETGQSIWTKDFKTYYRPGVNPDAGPRCVPVIQDGKIFLFGAGGSAHAVTLQDGSHLWSRDLYEDYGGDEGYFGAGSTPIVVGENVLFNVGGKRKQAGIVAVGGSNGKTIWKATRDAASYSSPIAIEKDGLQFVAFVTRLHLVLVDPANGRESVRHPFGTRGPTVNGATPVFFQDKLFLTSSYGIGAKLLDISGKTEKIVWENDSSLSSQYNTPVYNQGSLYGIHGREDLGVAELRCVSATNGDVAWQKKGFGVAHLILADKKLIALTIDGTIVLVRLDNKKYEEMGRLKIAATTTRALPALSNGQFFFRSEKKLYCVNIGASN